MKRLLKMMKKGWISLGLICAMVVAYFVSPLSGVHAGGYDYQKAVEYADRWGGSNRNPDYKSYSGADCANYVSQCLRAGGVDLGDDWKPYTLAWIQVPAMVRTFRARGYQVIENPTADQIYPGNPVIYQWKGSSYEWSHATICVGYDENGTPIINGHTSDRYHVKWNYGAGSANKMCTILINDGTSSSSNAADLGNIVDLGNEFYAYINCITADKPLTNDGNNVCIRSKGTSDEEIRSQVWKFVKRDDGSYVIYSTKDNKVLDVDGEKSTPETNVKTYPYWGGSAQHWYIYEKDGVQRFKAQCSECLMDLHWSDTSDGSNIQMYENNGTGAQMFKVEKVNTPGITKVYYTTGDESTPTTILWDATNDTTVYNVRISGDVQKDIWNVTGTSCEVDLPAGNYEVYVNACNAYSYSTSEKVKFTVEEATFNEPTSEEVDDDEEEEQEDEKDVEDDKEESEDEKDVEDDKEESGDEKDVEDDKEESGDEKDVEDDKEESEDEKDVEDDKDESEDEKDVEDDKEESEDEKDVEDDKEESEDEKDVKDDKKESGDEKDVEDKKEDTEDDNKNADDEEEQQDESEDDKDQQESATIELDDTTAIRFIVERDEEGRFIGLCLRIVLQGNKVNQVLTIRLI